MWYTSPKENANNITEDYRDDIKSFTLIIHSKPSQ